MGAMDELIDHEAVETLAAILTPGTRCPHLAAVTPSLEGRKLRARVDLVRDALLSDLPADYASTAAVIREGFEAPSLTGWALWPVSEAVVARALATERVHDFDDAMELLGLLTTRFTGEFAIRPMLVARLDRALGVAESWTQQPDESVRRLASEGTRSHLPWAMGVPELTGRPGVTRVIVDALYRDESETVRRSVANHVNDLSRDDPDLAAAIAGRWCEATDDHTDRVARHALRTLVKGGHRGALAVLGFTGAHFEVDGPHLTETVVPVGGAVSFTATVTNRGDEPARVAIDFVIFFQKARGAPRPKVFKIGVRTLEPGAATTIEKSYSFQERTTRVFHLGEHSVALQVNGEPHGRAAFELVPDPSGSRSERSATHRHDPDMDVL